MLSTAPYTDTVEKIFVIGGAAVYKVGICIQVINDDSYAFHLV